MKYKWEGDVRDFKEKMSNEESVCLPSSTGAKDERDSVCDHLGNHQDLVTRLRDITTDLSANQVHSMDAVGESILHHLSLE